MLSWLLYHLKAFRNGRVVCTGTLQATLLSCLFSVKPQAGQAAYLFQAWSLETIAHTFIINNQHICISLIVKISIWEDMEDLN
jgi:hypothetical protein